MQIRTLSALALCCGLAAPVAAGVVVEPDAGTLDALTAAAVREDEAAAATIARLSMEQRCRGRCGPAPTIEHPPVGTLPEPGTLALDGLALLFVALFSRRRPGA